MGEIIKRSVSIEFGSLEELKDKLAQYDKSKIVNLKLKCTDEECIKRINMDGFDSLKNLNIDNCSVVLSRLENGETRYFCEMLQKLTINNSIIESLTNIKSSEDDCDVTVSQSTIMSHEISEIIRFSLNGDIKYGMGNDCPDNRMLNDFFNSQPISMQSFKRLKREKRTDSQDLSALLSDKGYQFLGDDLYEVAFYRNLQIRNPKMKIKSIFINHENEVQLNIGDLEECLLSHDLNLLLKDGVIIKIENISDLSIDKLEQFQSMCQINLIQMMPNQNFNSYMHSTYSIETYKKCRKVIDSILEDIDEVRPDRSNEMDVFLQVYRSLGKIISYDEEAAHDNRIRTAVSRNLEGGLLRNESLCAGYAEILRNFLAARNIGCICKR